MDCKELKKQLDKCLEDDCETRECKEIQEKFEFECKKDESTSWFGFGKKVEEKKEEGEESEEGEEKKDDDKSE